MAAFPIERVRADFPVLGVDVHGHPLTYLDSAATTLKPRSVVDACNRYYNEECANIHRAVHYLSEKATASYESTRGIVREFLSAPDTGSVIFTSGTTAGINLVARSYGDAFLGPGDEIVITHMEHHSNIVPWQMLCERRGCVLKVAPITDAGEVDLDAFAALVGPRTRFVSVVHVSNSLGTVNPVKRMGAIAHAAGAKVLVDAAQSASSIRLDVRDLDCDFLVLSGHKLFGPTGIGVLYGRPELLEAMPPFMGGGDMILSVRFSGTTYAKRPYKFEAGTPPIAEVIGLGAAIEYVNALGLDRIAAHEADLLAYATRALSAVPGVRLFGEAREKASIISFLVDDVHAHDIGSLLDTRGIAVRTGHHCTQPVMERFRVPATARASLSIYNTREDVDRLVEGVRYVKEIMS